jgi:hypothetical protein
MNNEWSDISDSREAAKVALDEANRLESDQLWREQMHLLRLSVYHSRTIGNLESAQEMRRNPNDLLKDGWVGFAKSVVDTACAQIAAKQRPSCEVLTKGGDYRARIQAKEITRFLSGQFSTPQSGYANCYDLGLQIFNDACLGEGGVVYVEPDVAGERVNDTRLFSYDVFFDKDDALNGDPRNVWIRRRFKRSEAAKRWPKAKSRIKMAPAAVTNRVDGRGRITPVQGRDFDYVKVWECYALTRNGVEGRYIAVLEAGSNGPEALQDDTYDEREFPLEILTWKRHTYGMWGSPLIDQVEVPQEKANEVLQKIYETVKLLAGGIVDAEENSYSKEDLESNKTLKIMRRKPGKPGAQFIMPQPFNQATLSFAELMQGYAFSVPGVSEMAAQGRKEPGIEAGVAIRHMSDLQGQRFLPVSRNYEQFFVGLGRKKIAAIKRLAAVGVKPKSWLPSNGLIQEIEWADFNPSKEDVYDVQLAAGNAMTESIAYQKQTVLDLLQMGLMPNDVAERLLTSGNPDIEQTTARRQAQYNWIERLIQEVHAERDPEVEIELEPPDPLMAPMPAIQQMTEAYLEMSSYKGTPENKRRAIRNWIVLMVDLLSKQNQPAAPPPGPAAPPPGPAVPPPGPAAPPPGPEAQLM